jgi:hypothetical protein
VPPATVFALQQAAEQEGARLVLVTRPGARRAVADLVATAERVQQSRADVVAELEHWTPPPGSNRLDGVPTSAYPQRPPASGPQELTVRDFDAGRSQGAPRPAELPVPSGGPAVVAVVVTPGDRPSDWLTAGQALHRVLLVAAGQGVQASLHGQVPELDGLRRLLRDELLVEGSPQMLLQLGHAPARGADGSPRRPVAEVLERA